MATRTFTYGGVNELASTAGNWDTAPVDNDTVIIAAGSNCCWDLDTSAWANGVAGLTITSHATTPAMLYFQTSGTANHLKIKTGTTINGTNAAVKGRLLANADGVWANSVSYPAAARATIEHITTGYTDGTYLDVKILCAEPITPKVKLASNAAATQAVLVVDTDVSAQWANGDLISICDLQQAPEQETRAILSIVGTTITCTTNLTASKVAGTYPCEISLINRNVKIIGGAGSAQKCIANLGGANQTVNAWLCPTTAGQGYGFADCTTLVCSGGFHGPGAVGDGLNGWSRGCYSCTVTMSGTVTQSGNSSGCNTCTVTMSGTVTQSGNNSGCNTCTVTMSGTVTQSGNTYGCTSCTVTMSGTVTQIGNSTGCYSCTVTMSGTVTQSGNTYGCYSCTVTMSGTVTQSGNTYGLRRCPFGLLNNVVMGDATENYEYNTLWVPDHSYVMSKNHDGVTGTGKSWSPGGITLTSVVSPPTGFTIWRQITCESATRKGFHQEVATIRPGETLKVTGFIRIDASHVAYPPRLQILSQFADPLVNAANTPLATMSIPGADGTDPTYTNVWQAVTVQYTNTDSIATPVFIRVVGMHLTENIDFAWKFAYDYPATTDVRSPVSFAFGSTGLCNVPTAAQTLLAVPVDATVGTVTLPVETNVKNLIPYGPALGQIGSYSPDFPSVGNVLITDTVDGVPGTLTLPIASNVWYGSGVYGVGGSGSTPSKRGSSITNLSAGNIKIDVHIDDVVGTLGSTYNLYGDRGNLINL